jgi:salicylate hydroxylase
MYNLVMSHPGKVKDARKFGEQGEVDEMRAQYSNYHPTVKRILQHVDSCLKWQLSELPSLKSWSSANGRVVIIGDAAHAMLPFLAQVLYMRFFYSALATC